MAKLTGSLSRLLGKGGGSALPGLLAEQSDDEILAQLGSRLKHGSIVITGTNGKTTTTKMIEQILESNRYKVLTNRSGSNLSRGIVSTLIEKISWTGNFKAEVGLFEVDEASMPAVCAALKPQAVVVLNLFRDQLDRYGELDTTAAMIGRAIAPLKTELYLNADDPLVASLAKYLKPDQDYPDQDQVLNTESNQTRSKTRSLSTPNSHVHYFGVQDAEVDKLAHDLAADSDHCPLDGAELKYSQNFFGHIGHYVCPKGDFERPIPQTVLTGYRSGQAFEISAGQSSTKLYLPLPGLYNAYNALAAVCLTNGLGIDVVRSCRALESVTAAFGRVERLEIDGRTVYLLLIKNPTGFNQVIQTFLAGDKGHSLMIAINDNFADGRDVSWLWDVAIEELRVKHTTNAVPVGRESKPGHSGHKIVVSGVRALDMALRFKYADQKVAVEANLEEAFKQTVAAAAPGETVYIMPTYTAMLELRQRIRALGLVKGYWE